MSSPPLPPFGAPPAASDPSAPSPSAAQSSESAQASAPARAAALDGPGFAGGVFTERVAGGRAGATLRVHPWGVEASAADGSAHPLRYEGMRLELGGASGHMLFLRDPSGAVTLFSEDEGLRAALRKGAASHPEASRIAAALDAFDQERHRTRRNTRLGWGAAVAVLAVLVALTPAAFRGLVKRAVRELPTSVDEKLGELASDGLVKAGDVVTDAEVTAAMDQIMKRLEAAAPKSTFRYRVFVVRAPEINAFALPGGTLIVNTALLEKATGADQVAGVLAHEIAHVTERHTMERVASSLTLVAAISLLVGDVSGLLALGVELSKTAAVNSYGRAQENDADRIGVGILHRAGLRPEGLAEFFRMLEASGQGDAALFIPEWLRTHAENENRVRAIGAEIARLGPSTPRPLDIDWPKLQARLVPGAAIGDSPPAK